MKESLTSRERVRLAFARLEPDRVPVDYLANPGIDAKLKQHFALRADDDEGLRQKLGVDFFEVIPPYVGPPPVPLRNSRQPNDCVAPASHSRS